MNIEKPVTYKAVTWDAISSRITKMSTRELAKLSAKANIRVGDKVSLLDALINRGGFLLVELCLTTDPDIMKGTFFDHGIHEYYLDEVAACQLAEGREVQLRHPGGDLAEVLSATEVLEDLKTSSTFDQLDRI